MHQTTIRFGSDLWESLAVAASAEGVSVAQYVRESAVERLIGAGAFEDGQPVAATDRRRDARAPRRDIRGTAAPTPSDAIVARVASDTGSSDAQHRAALRARVVDGGRATAHNTESSAAVWAQSRLARARSRELRATSRALAAEREAARAAAARRRGSAGDGVAPAPLGAVAPVSRARA